MGLEFEVGSRVALVEEGCVSGGGEDLPSLP